MEITWKILEISAENGLITHAKYFETAYIGFLINQFQSGPLIGNYRCSNIIIKPIQWAEICNQSKKYAIINT